MLAVCIEIFVLVTALSVDAFAAGFAYGVSKIKVPFRSLLIVTGASSLILALSLLLGRLAGALLPPGLTGAFGFVVLAGLGVFKFFDRTNGREAEKADKNRDQVVSPAEALALGAALSVDSLAAGIGAGALFVPIPAAFLTSVLVGGAALLLGEGLGGFLSARFRSSFSWVSGCLLLLLAFLKLL